jgi:hypothetical protein
MSKDKNDMGELGVNVVLTDDKAYRCQKCGDFLCMEEHIIEYDKCERCRVKLKWPTQTREELRIMEALLNERQKVLDAIPECKEHGKCVPHALEWIEKQKTPNPATDEALEIVEGYIAMCNNTNIVNAIEITSIIDILTKIKTTLEK